MPKKIVSKQKIVQAAQWLVERGEMPTLAAVRLKLGNQGSLSTIHKYLKEWKESCFKQEFHENDIGYELRTVVEEKKILEQLLQQQKLQNEQYSQELIKAEKSLLQLKMEIQGLDKENLQLQMELKELEREKDHFRLLYEEIKIERSTLYEKEINEKNRFIQALQEELKTANQQAITELRNSGYEKDDTLMQEKVKIINLQEKVIQLTEENKNLTNQFNNEKQLNSQIRLKLKTYQKIIEECVPKEVQEKYNPIAVTNEETNPI